MVEAGFVADDSAKVLGGVADGGVYEPDGEGTFEARFGTGGDYLMEDGKRE